MKGRLPKPAAHHFELIKAETRYAAEELIRHERFIGEVYDAHRSDDGIADAFVANGNAVFLTSLDFLTYDRGCTNVVTEPRLELGVAYARKAVSLISQKAALLLPVAWMAAEDTKQLFDGTPIARIYVLTKRLRFRIDSGKHPVPMAWYLWERGHFERPIVILI